MRASEQKAAISDGSEKQQYFNQFINLSFLASEPVGLWRKLSFWKKTLAMYWVKVKYPNSLNTLEHGV